MSVTDLVSLVVSCCEVRDDTFARASVCVSDKRREFRLSRKSNIGQLRTNSRELVVVVSINPVSCVECVMELCKTKATLSLQSDDMLSSVNIVINGLMDNHLIRKERTHPSVTSFSLDLHSSP